MDNTARKHYRKIGRIGNSYGFTLPKEALEELNVKQGDVVELSIKDGKLTVQRQETQEIDSQFLQIAERAFKRYDKAFKALRDR
ncbi:AbrB/MazE/SpoVT family DNA-binding domain-containing protein [Shimazuella alba]|uniref:AbrB/MazE/SpoVT family DNA-binding domain-containing protein n=1 Tax=Shimazuella alba TaxID=2690964 RepID=A0A6I4VR76_9BACL|nr:AbrB/MazE/SpoVT family DNA-binding domain-containing protein [Shimazuella alba]MXQ53603.1 AbrB/MazE/SpoVT family DNA-binding domain-containing protein [Shimazuella alba]